MEVNVSKSLIDEIIQEQKESLIKLSHQIWSLSEVSMKEYKSSQLLKKFLKKEGFHIQENIASLKTGFVATFGISSPCIAFLGEYDALPELSQVSSKPEKESRKDSLSGHGCGHNLLGVGALGAAIALKEVVSRKGVGCVKFFGCPGEEKGSGKAFMSKEGCFDDVDIALTWHPSDSNAVLNYQTLANLSYSFYFEGVSSHAAVAPHLGRSALDAVELMNVGSNYLREHVLDDVRFHYAIVNSGGYAPNIVQANSEVLYYIRAPRVKEAKYVAERIEKIAQGAALMTDTVVKVAMNEGVSEYIPNPVINRVLYDEFRDSKGPVFSTNEFDLGKNFYDTLSNEVHENSNQQLEAFYQIDMSNDIIVEKIAPLLDKVLILPASTDVGDVSQVVPTGQITVSCAAKGTPLHSWQYTAQADSVIGYKGMLKASEVLAKTGLRFLEDSKLIDEAEACHNINYNCPIPSDVFPKYEED